MRWVVAILTLVACAAAAEGQVVWLGAGANGSWEVNPDAYPDDDWVGGSSIQPTGFIALPVSDDHHVIFRGCQLSHDVVSGEAVFSGRLRGLTVGVDYFLAGVFGKAVFSAGLGGYKLDLKQANPPAGVEGWEFGWYLGVGEWFPITRKSRITVDVTMHQTAHPGKPIIFALAAGVAVGL